MSRFGDYKISRDDGGGWWLAYPFMDGWSGPYSSREAALEDLDILIQAMAEGRGARLQGDPLLSNPYRRLATAEKAVRWAGGLAPHLRDAWDDGWFTEDGELRGG